MIVLGRSVQLMRGEATFTVTHPALRPLDLTADGQAFRTRAATFDIRLTGRHAMHVTVLRGTLLVFPSDAGTAVSPVASQQRDSRPLGPIRLDAGQTFDLEPGRETARTLSELDIQSRIAWQRQ